MKYMQNGGFQQQPMMRLTLACALVFLAGFWATNLAMYFSRMSLDPDSVRAYYLGSEAEYTAAKTAGAMLEVSHAHLPMMAMVLLLLTHLLIFAPLPRRTQTAFIIAPFAAALLNEAAGWLVRFVHPGFAAVKVAAFVAFETMLGLLIAALAWYLFWPRQPRLEVREPYRVAGKGRLLHT